MKEHFPFLFWAYNLIWIFFAAYLALIFIRQGRLRREIEDLKSKLGKDAG